MIMNHLVVSLPVSAGVLTEDEIVKRWNKDLDFRNRTIGVSGTYANRRDVEQYFPEVDSVEIRFNQDVDLVVMRKQADGSWIKNTL